MISRYTHPDMGRLWSDHKRFETWLQVEIAAAEAWDRSIGDTIRKPPPNRQ